MESQTLPGDQQTQFLGRLGIPDQFRYYLASQELKLLRPASPSFALRPKEFPSNSPSLTSQANDTPLYIMRLHRHSLSPVETAAMQYVPHMEAGISGGPKAVHTFYVLRLGGNMGKTNRGCRTGTVTDL